ncbi:hypothetical protein GTGU_04673, partial [Trabulsiella guamensis ATCC 49490]
MLTPVTRAEAVAPVALNREQVALNRSQPDATDLLVTEGLQDWQRTGDAFTSPVLSLAQASDSFDEFL